MKLTSFNPTLFRLLPRFRFSSIANQSLFHKIENKKQFLEELIQEPVLTQSAENNMTYHERMEMKNFLPSTSFPQINDALQSEFHETIRTTDWSEYEPLDSAVNAAGNLAREYILNYKIKNGKVPTSKEIETECDTLYKESQSGDYSRYLMIDTVDELEGTIEDSLKDVYFMAKNALASNPYIHPIIKKQYLAIVAKYLQKQKK